MTTLAGGPPMGGGGLPRLRKGGTPAATAFPPTRSAGIRLPPGDAGFNSFRRSASPAASPFGRGGAIAELWALTSWRELAVGAVLFGLIGVGVFGGLLL